MNEENFGRKERKKKENRRKQKKKWILKNKRKNTIWLVEKKLGE